MTGPTSLSTAPDEPRRSKTLTSAPQIRYRELLVTSRQLRENRADWWVPSADASCQYLSDWVATKTRWKLTIDQAEKQALTDRAAQCPDTRIDTELAH